MPKKNKQEIFIMLGIVVILIILFAYWLQDNSSSYQYSINQQSTTQNQTTGTQTSKNVISLYTIVATGNTNAFQLDARSSTGVHTGPTGLIQGIQTSESKIPGSSFTMLSNQESIILDSNHSYTVDISGKSPAFVTVSLIVSKAGQSKPTIYITPNNFQTVYGSKATLKLPVNGTPVLLIDNNSDGVVDSQVSMKLQ